MGGRAAFQPPSFHQIHPHDLPPYIYSILDWTTLSLSLHLPLSLFILSGESMIRQPVPSFHTLFHLDHEFMAHLFPFHLFFVSSSLRSFPLSSTQLAFCLLISENTILISSTSHHPEWKMQIKHWVRNRERFRNRKRSNGRDERRGKVNIQVNFGWRKKEDTTVSDNVQCCECLWYKVKTD